MTRTVRVDRVAGFYRAECTEADCGYWHGADTLDSARRAAGRHVREHLEDEGLDVTVLVLRASLLVGPVSPEYSD